MAYATGTRLAAAFCFLTVILSPLGVWLMWVATKKEKAAEERNKAIKQMAE